MNNQKFCPYSSVSYMRKDRHAFYWKKEGGNREGRAATTTYYDGLAMCKRMIKEIKKALALHGLLRKSRKTQ